MTSLSGEGPPACPVCGAAIGDDPRLCEKCETPHHADCWGYTGRCAVYACMPASAPVAVAVGALPPFAESADRVQPIVPVPAMRGADVSRLPTWRADAQGAWAGGRDPAITVAPGERVVTLPRNIVREIRHPEELARAQGLLGRIIVGFAAAFITAVCALTTGIAAFKLICAFSLSIAVSAWLASKHTPAQRAWITVSGKGTWVHGITAGRPWEFPVEGRAAPRRVRLERSYETCSTDIARTLLTYRLVIQWALGHEADDIRLTSRDLAPELQMPETAAERRPVLEQLVARRALGQHIAAVLSIPFEEGVRPS